MMTEPEFLMLLMAVATLVMAIIVYAQVRAMTKPRRKEKDDD